MIELPESHTLKSQLHRTVTGKIINKVTANHSPHKFAWFHGDPGEYHPLLSGKKITGAASYGGLIEVQAENTCMVFGDGTNLRYFPAGEKLPDKHQLLIEFEDQTALVCSVQMYGALWAMEGDCTEGYYLSSKSKTAPLSEQFDETYFLALLQSCKQNLSAKAFLATEQRIPGLGNGVLQDILFHAKLHPKRKLMSLSENEILNMYRSVKHTLSEMTEQGGRDTEKDLFGHPGGYRTRLSAKTKDNPCPVCGDSIIREAYLGGNVYYCPTCQRI